jgi:aspartyl-tRNA(Asn)/glutamyl-tRNA(Gln) amidotransferase subunit A
MAITETITQLASRMAGGLTSREAVVSKALETALSKDAAHVFTRLYIESALASARHADAQAKAGAQLPVLAGLPVSIKDLYDVAGEPTLAGSTVYRNNAPALADAPTVTRIRAAGAAIIGRTNMTEFAFSGVGINPHHGTPRNPADQQIARIPGGSSSGAAVSVALGLAVAGLGSDTGGSIRIPAALCGLVGFKGTQARIPRNGMTELSRSLDTACAMTRSVSDCILVDGILAGQPLRTRPRGIEGMRLAVPQTVVLDDLDATVARAFARAIERLSAAGARIVEVPLLEIAEISKINAPGGFSAVEGYAAHHAALALDRAGFDPRVAARMSLGESVSAQQYISMQDRRAEWITRMETKLMDFDAMLCPTVPIVAPEMAPLIASDETFFKVNALLLRNPFVINFMDGCAFSIPCHDSGELPVGLMCASRRGEDEALAGVALAIERCLSNRFNFF